MGEKRSKADLQTAIRHMVTISHKTFSQVSREIDRGRNFISVMFRDNSTPRLDLMAKIANACGYDLVLLGHGEGIAITATPKTDGTRASVERRWRVVEHDDGSLALTPTHDDAGYWEYEWEDHYGDGTVEHGPTDQPPAEAR